jgi:hypothetical protein
VQQEVERPGNRVGARLEAADLRTEIIAGQRSELRYQPRSLVYR